MKGLAIQHSPWTGLIILVLEQSNPENTAYSAIDNDKQSNSGNIDDISMNIIDNSMETNDIQIEIHHEGV